VIKISRLVVSKSGGKQLTQDFPCLMSAGYFVQIICHYFQNCTCVRNGRLRPAVFVFLIVDLQN